MKIAASGVPILPVSRHEELWRLQQQTHSPTNPGSHSQRVMPAPTIGFSSAPRRASSRTEGGAGRQRSHGLSDRMIAWLFIAPTILLLLVINIFRSFGRFSSPSPTSRRTGRSREFKMSESLIHQYFMTGEIWSALQITAHFSGRSCKCCWDFRWRGWLTASSAGTPSGRR